MKRVQYSRHLSIRLNLRRMPSNLPRTIYLRSRRKYFDTATNTFVALLRTKLYGKTRDVMIVYREQNDVALIITVHPLKHNQLNNRLQSGRWKKF